MDDLIGLIETFRRAATTEARRDAAEAVVRLVNPSLYLFLLRRAPEAVDELRGDVLLQIAKSLHTCKATTNEEAWGWCYTIARRNLGDYFVDKESERVVFVDPEMLTRLADSTGQVEPFSNEADRMDIAEALAILKSKKPECYSLLWERFIVGRSPKEIAKAKGLKYDNVLRKISRCLDGLPF